MASTTFNALGNRTPLRPNTAPVPAQRNVNRQQFASFLERFKPQLALALPSHQNADRLARLTMTACSLNEKLLLCTPESVAASVMTAAMMGLEPGIGGQGYLIPYRTTCTFVPGWRGMVDIANRSGRCSVWTGAVFAGDDFDYSLGDSPFIRHKPRDEDNPDRMTHVYAVGRVSGSNWAVIEVWSAAKIWRHRDRYNKLHNKNEHYSFREPEMYARKVPLLQVLKYMPASVELNTAIGVSEAIDSGRTAFVDPDNFVSFTDLDYSEPEKKPETQAREEARPEAKPEVKPDARARARAEAPAERDTGGQSNTTYAQVLELMIKARTHEALNAGGERIGEIASPEQRRELTYKLQALRDEMPDI